MFIIDFFNFRSDTPQESGILKQHQKELVELQKIESHKARKQALCHLGQKILANGEKWRAVNWRQYALMHNASLIRYTDLEGGEVGISVEAWKFFFTTLSKGEGHFFSLNLNKKQYKAIFSALDDLAYFHNLLPKSGVKALTESEILILGQSFQKAIKSRLQKQGVVYLPLGYRHGVSNEGHAITCKVELHDNGYVTFHPLNLGNGSENHPVLNYTETQEKISFRHYPFEVPPDRMWGKVGLAALCHLMRYMADPPHPRHDHYEGEDLLEIFYILGELVPSLGERAEMFEAKSQRAGNCSEKAVHNVVHDVVIETDLSQVEIKRLFLNIKMLSNVAGYHSHLQNPSEKSRFLLRNSTEEFGIALQKFKPHLHPHEYLVAIGLIEAIQATTKKPLAFTLSTSLEKKKNDVKVSSAPQFFPTLETDELTALKELTWDPSASGSSLPPTLYREPTFDITICTQNLEQWIQIIGKLKPKEAYHFFESATFQLPLPEWKQKDPWDTIDQKQIPQILKKFEKLVTLGLKDNHISSDVGESKGLFIRQVLAIHTIYAIADKLARKCPWTKLDDFACPFIPLLNRFQYNDFTTIPLGIENHRYSQIYHYFKKSYQDCNNSAIFPIDPIIQVEQALYEASHGGNWSQGRNHILFLQRHIYDLYPTASNVKLLPLFMKTWLEMKTVLPAEVNTLYFFAYLSGILFYAEGGHYSPFPEELKFIQGTDNSGKKALSIQAKKDLFHHHPSNKKKEDHEKPQYPRFDSFFQEGQFQIFHPYYQKMTTNDAVCIRLTEKDTQALKLSEPLFRDLLRITRKKNLKLLLAVQWASKNLIHLENKEVQIILDHCFFAPRQLYEKLKEDPQYIEKVRKMIMDGLNYYRDNPNHFNCLLFLIRTGIFFETQLIALYGREKSQLQLLFYHEKLEKLRFQISDKKQTSSLQLHQMLAQLYQYKRSEEETTALLITLFNPTLFEYYIDHDWLRNRKQDFFSILAPQLKEAFKDPLLCNRICRSLISHLIPEIDHGNSHWEGVFPQYCSDSYAINFLAGTVEECTKGKLNLSVDFKYDCIGWSSLTAKHGTKFWAQNGCMESVDGQLRVGYKNHEIIYERQINIGNEKRWARIFMFRTSFIDEVHLSFLNDHHHIPLIHYLLLDRKEDDPDIITFDYEKDEPFFRIDFNQSKSQITRVDKNGKRLPIYLVNLAEIYDPKDPLHQYVLRFAPPPHVLCWINRENGSIEELNFYRLKLQFKKDKKGFESVQFPGFYLQISETLEEIDHFPATLILQNKFLERKIFIPTFKLRPEATENLSKKVAFQKDTFFETPKLLSFEVDPISGMLHNSDFLPNLYLALILAIKGNEVKALKYLQKVKKEQFFNQDENALLYRFTELKDQSPRSLAFNAKLFFTIADNMNLMLEEKFKKNSHHSLTLISWGQKIYIDYLKAISRDNLSAIPKNLRLSIEEEKAILRLLMEFAQKNKHELPQMLQLRHKLLTTEDEHVVATISPKEVSLFPAIFSKVGKPSELRYLKINYEEFPYGNNRKKEVRKWEDISLDHFSNRMTVEALEAHFIELYEQARKCKPEVPDPFDFTLLACLKVKSVFSTFSTKLAHILFYVRHFPHLFRDLVFQEGDDTANIKTFNQIVKRVCKLEKSDAYKRRMEKALNQRETFQFSRKTPLKALHHSSEQLPITFAQEKQKEKIKPFQAQLTSLFRCETKLPVLPHDPPFLESGTVTPSDKIEEEITSRFQRGYAKLKMRSQKQYHLHKEKLEETKGELEYKQVQLRGELIALRKTIIKAANTPYKISNGALQEEPLHQELDWRLRQHTGQNLTLLPETIIKEAILKNNAAYLTKHSPLLTDTARQKILEQVIDYYYGLTLHQLCKEALLLIKKIENDPTDKTAANELAELLDYQFLDPKEFPEVFYFKVTEGKLPRPEQVPIYKWISKALSRNEKVGFQLKAGGGKTDYLTPLLMMRAKREGLMPIFLSTQMMYAVDKANLNITLTKLDHQLAYLEVGLHMKFSAEQLQFIFEELKEYHQEGRSLIMTPQTYYTLRLQYFFAGLQENDEGKVKYLGLILNFFETHCLQIGDEAHRNYDPLTRAIFGIGDFFNLPKEENQLFLELLKPLLGFESVLCENGQPLSQLSRMEKNLVGTPTDKEIQLIQKTVAQHMSHSKLLDIPEAERASIITYWTNQKTAQPPYLLSLGKSKNGQAQAGLIALTGNFILNLIPQIVRLRTELDHSRSLFQEEEFDTPCHHKTPSTAQYENAYLTDAVSIKGTAHRGLSDLQVRNLLIKLLELDLKEQHEKGIPDTPISQTFSEWMKNSALETVKLRDIALSNPHQMKQLHKICSKHQEVIEYYLTHFILPQIGYCLSQLNCTPTHLFYGSKQAIICTATPLSRMIYPHALKELKFDPYFEAEVATQFCKKENQHKISVKSPDSFFEESKTQFPAEFAKAEVFLDPNGFFCDYPNDEIAKKWLSASQLDGVLYFKEGRSLSVDKNQKITLLLRDPDDPKKFREPIELNGSNIREAFKSHNLAWDQLRIGTYYDASHTESANITQKKGATAFIFVGDGLTISRLNQALLRVRGLLDEKMFQNIMWVYTQEVAQKIQPEFSKINGPSVFKWTVQNEAKELRKKIILNAFQEIGYLIELPTLLDLKNQLENPAEQIAIMKKHQKGLLENKVHNPYATFGDHEQEKECEIVLMQFAKAQYAKFNYDIEFEQNLPLQAQIREIIKLTKNYIQDIPVNWEKMISLEIEQHTQLKQDSEQTDYRPRHRDPISAEGEYGKLYPFLPHYPYSIWKFSANGILNTKGLTESFYLEINHLKTAKNSQKSFDASYLKPIDFFEIILQEGQKPMAIANSNEIVSGMLKNLIEKPDKNDTDQEYQDPKIKHQIFFVTANGEFVRQGKGRLQPNPEELQKILKSQWMQDLVIDAALLRGEIIHPDRLLERIKKWEGFKEFWEAVVKAQPNPETVNQKAMARLLTK